MSGLLIDEIADTVREIAATREGRLVAVTVVTPPPMAPAEVRAVVADLLRRAGFGEVSVRTITAMGPFRLVSAEFER